IVGITEAASAGHSKEEGCPVRTAAGDVRVSGSRRAEADGAIGAVVIEPAVDGLQIVETEFEVVPALNPRGLFLKVRGPLARIREHAVSPGDATGAVGAGSAGSERRHSTGYIGGTRPSRRSLAHITRSFDDVSMVVSDGEVVQNVRRYGVIVV